MHSFHLNVEMQSVNTCYCHLIFSPEYIKQEWCFTGPFICRIIILLLTPHFDQIPFMSLT